MKVWDSEKPEGKSGRKYLLPQAEWRSGVEWSEWGWRTEILLDSKMVFAAFNISIIADKTDNLP